VNEQLLKIIQAVNEVKNCFNCVHIDKPNSLCKKFGSQPPMRIIEVGCPQHEKDIPF
jgi:hypothetical protein